MKTLILAISVLMSLHAFGSTNSAQMLKRSCEVTPADQNPEYSSLSVMLYVDNSPADAPAPGAPETPMPDRKATLVLQGAMFTGTSNFKMTSFKSDDGNVTASFSPDSTGATTKIWNQIATYSHCKPKLSD